MEVAASLGLDVALKEVAPLIVVDRPSRVVLGIFVCFVSTIVLDERATRVGDEEEWRREVWRRRGVATKRCGDEEELYLSSTSTMRTMAIAAMTMVGLSSLFDFHFSPAR
jgi:hypothetical protein